METTMTISSLLADMTTIFSSIMEWVGVVLTTISSNPILLVFVVGSFALVAIGVVRRLLAL